MTPPKDRQRSSSRPAGRRPHRKSRKGCLVCKRRRVKCDERHPRCGPCALGDRDCSYEAAGDCGAVPAAAAAPSGGSSSTGPVGSSSHGATSPGSSPADGGIGGRGSSDCPPAMSPDLAGGEEGPGSGSRFSSVHMALLHHAETNLDQYLPLLQCSSRPVIDVAVRSAVTAPYLLDQLLALSALHLSRQNPTTASFYHYQATNLQTRALGLFNQVKEEISESNCVPTFLFTTLLGIHVLRDTLSNLNDRLDPFISDFVSYIRLHRGVRAVTNRYWSVIRESELKSLFYVSEWIDGASERVSGTETDKLRAFLEASLPPSSCRDACVEALKWVQLTIDVAALEPERVDLPVQLTTAWPLILPIEYVDALYQHRPEALVVMAYYTTMLHRHRQYCVFENAGKTLTRLISSHVGPFWAEALAWPHEQLSL